MYFYKTSVTLELIYKTQKKKRKCIKTQNKLLLFAIFINIFCVRFFIFIFILHLPFFWLKVNLIFMFISSIYLLDLMLFVVVFTFSVCFSFILFCLLVHFIPLFYTQFHWAFISEAFISIKHKHDYPMENLFFLVFIFLNGEFISSFYF